MTSEQPPHVDLNLPTPGLDTSSSSAPGVDSSSSNASALQNAKDTLVNCEVRLGPSGEAAL
jgi:hypothetical protein